MECRFKTRRKNEEVNYVLVSFNCNGHQYRYQTSYSCEKKDWGSGYPKKINSTKELRDRLDIFKKKCDDFINDIIQKKNRIPTKYELDQFMDLIRGKASRDITISDYVSRYLEYKLPTVAENTKQCIQLHVNHFESHFGAISLDDLDQTICRKYTRIVHGLGFQVSTLNGYFKDVKAFLRWLYKQDFTLINYSKYLESLKQNEKPVIALTQSELITLESVDLNNNRLESVRDVFLFSCYTGLRYSDVKNFKKEMIRGNLIHITSQKTKEHLRIPIIEECRILLEKHDYDLPVISEQKTNSYLKELFSIIGLNRTVEKKTQNLNATESQKRLLSEIITFHIARKTFITVALLRGVPERVVRSISGHKKDSDFRKYLAFVDQDLSIQMNKFSYRA